jgi:toxin ParE1/3/4
MNWRIDYTSDALRDLITIFEYISISLLQPGTAVNQTNRIMDSVDTLDHMPFRYRLYPNEPWHSRGLRCLPVDNYIIFYLPKELEKVVTIIRIMYGGRDIDNQLANVHL